MKPKPDSSTNGRSRPRFNCADPPHPDNPDLIDWQVWMDGQRISIDQLVREANRLQRWIDRMQTSLESLLGG